MSADPAAAEHEPQPHPIPGKRARTRFPARLAIQDTRHMSAQRVPPSPLDNPGPELLRPAGPSATTA
ncbi:MAG: hypothetical protein ACRC0L_10480, partial [Angustibacter sp.]